MKALFHSLAALSIGLVAALGVTTSDLRASNAPRNVAAPAQSPYYGRWAVSEERPVFTAKGRLYKTIDIAPCGRDFCGVSVSDANQCGAVLFRFLGSHADGDSTLRGHGRWGAATKTVQIDSYEMEGPPAGRGIDLYLGDGHDFGERSENMPKFHGEYRRLGEGRCTTR